MQRMHGAVSPTPLITMQRINSLIDRARPAPWMLLAGYTDVP